MLLNYAQAFAVAAADIEQARVKVLLAADQAGTTWLDPANEAVQNFRLNLETLLATCDQVGQLERMRGPLGRLLARLGQGMDAMEMHHTVSSLQLQLFDELNLLRLYHVEERLVPFYVEEAPFGDEVFNSFPSANDDIASAGKCLALGQPTACVFHLMRVMEVGLRALSKELGIPYAPSWESHIRQLSAKMAEKHASKARGWKKREPFFKEVVGDLEAVKLAWRNPTMHIVKNFDQEQAENIYRAVRAFMKHLAGNVKEPIRAAPAAFGVVEAP